MPETVFLSKTDMSPRQAPPMPTKWGKEVVQRSRHRVSRYGEKGAWCPTVASLMPLLHSAFPLQQP